MSHNPFSTMRDLRKMLEWLKRFFKRKSKVNLSKVNLRARPRTFLYSNVQKDSESSKYRLN